MLEMLRVLCKKELGWSSDCKRLFTDLSTQEDALWGPTMSVSAGCPSAQCQGLPSLEHTPAMLQAAPQFVSALNGAHDARGPAQHVRFQRGAWRRTLSLMQLLATGSLGVRVRMASPGSCLLGPRM